MSVLRALGAVLVAIVVVSTFACSGNDTSIGDDLDGWNVLLVTLDTTRADRIGCLGAENAGTPVLDRLAGEGVLFERAQAHAPITLPTHASIFTGTYPPYHGVRGNGFYSLPESSKTLAEMLADAGYDTGAVIAARVLDRRFGLAQGFRVFDDQPGSMTRGNAFTDYTRDAAAVNEAAFRVLDELETTSPFFLWVHYFDPHAPYDPPAEFAANHPATEQGRYQAEIASMDARLGDLLAELERRGHAEKTLVVVTADHGEGIYGPHEELNHGIFVYEETQHVPLVFYATGGLPAGVRRREIARQIDVTPTILDLLALPEADEAQGVSLRPLLTSDADAALDEPLWSYSESMMPWYKFGWSPLLAIRDERWKFVEAPTPELYDLEADPNELDNVAELHPELVAQYRERIQDLLAAGGRDAFTEGLVVSEEERQKLVALGYTSSGRRLPEGEGMASLGKLKDPKDWAHIQQRLAVVRGHVQAGRDDEARRSLEQIVTEDPQNYEAYAILIPILLRAKELDEAKRRLDEVVAFRPEMGKTWVAYGYYERTRAGEHARRGEEAEARAAIDRAVECYERAVELDRFDSGPMLQLATLYFQLGRFDDAERVLRRALEIDANDAKANSMMAQILMRRGEIDEAIAGLERALEAGPSDRQALRAVLGQLIEAYAGRKDTANARRMLDRFVRDFPGDPAAEPLRAAVERAEGG